MRRTHSDRVERPAVARRGWLLFAGALVALGLAAPLTAQQDTAADDTVAVAGTDSVIGASVTVSDDDASLDLELSNGRRVEFDVNEGQLFVDGEPIGGFETGGALDRSWRALLEDAAMASTAELPSVLRAWEPPANSGFMGRELDERLEQALAGVGGRVPSKSLAASPEDSIDRLLAEIEELREEAENDEHVFVHDDRDDFAHDVLEGIAAFFATLVWMGVLLALGAALLFFAEGRLERVSATVRDEPLRSGLIGLAGLFLALPLYILVTLALGISIIGIPLILAWLPLFPLFLVLAIMIGWLSVAYSAGDAMVSGKLQTRPLFQSAGGVKRLLVGIGLLLSPFLIAAMFRMTSVLEWVGGLLFGVGFVGNMLVAAVGFGAVLVRGRDALDRHREKRAAARRAKLEQTPVIVTPENTNV